MTKIKATKKEMRNGYNRIISIGYCNLQSLLDYERPIAYSAGINGWSCDYYVKNNILISTGYNPLKNKNTKAAPFEVIMKYEDAARSIRYEYNLPFEQKKERLSSLLNQFINECIAD